MFCVSLSNIIMLESGSLPVDLYINAHIHALKYFEDHMYRLCYMWYMFVLFLKQGLLCPRWLQSMCNCTPEAPVLTLKCWDPGVLHQNCLHFDLLSQVSDIA